MAHQGFSASSPESASVDALFFYQKSPVFIAGDEEKGLRILGYTNSAFKLWAVQPFWSTGSALKFLAIATAMTRLFALPSRQK
ncbi:hypothetical protein [uncultured Endozoicomonas sp.]|uniref:hypothetical protein n=1 Tax=uncultured Endozoicomonas sp. TaxID=432652 RepID=UPI00261C42C7|nr:hypothetical protein [uncultured Endozoicomonas sp.]